MGVTSIPGFVIPKAPNLPSMVQDDELDRHIDMLVKAYPAELGTSPAAISRRRAFAERCDRQIANLKRKLREQETRKAQEQSMQEYDELLTTLRAERRVL